jgi:hypothetical protein
MSLITLTFNGTSTEKADSIGRGKIRVIKTQKFYGMDDICVIGKLVDGAISTNMHLSGTNALVKSVESNYGLDSCIRAGAQIVLMVSNANKDQFSSGQEIQFEKAIEVAQRPKGRVIIA